MLINNVMPILNEQDLGKYANLLQIYEYTDEDFTKLLKCGHILKGPRGL